jgi:hypothetical protein
MGLLSPISPKASGIVTGNELLCILARHWPGTVSRTNIGYLVRLQEKICSSCHELKRPWEIPIGYADSY